MANLKDILYKVHTLGLQGSTSRDIGSIHLDSRSVKPRGLFVAIRGVHTDGHEFIEQAIENGAAAIICEAVPQYLYEQVTYIRVEDSAEACGTLASNFYGNPSDKLTLIGVTGTNGKTTIATLLFQLFRSMNYSCGLLSTVQNQINSEVIEATHTTPDVIHLHGLLAQMAEAGCTHAFMEVSSHAIHQKRIAGALFAGGIFSNITHDHLDYHKTFEEYIRVKKSYFDALPAGAFALSNADDRRGAIMLQNTRARKVTYGLKNAADIKGKILENNLNGLVMMIEEQEVHFRMIGEFNAYNILAVYGAAVQLGHQKQEVLTYLSNLKGAEGRFDFQLSSRQQVMAIVDYAHTPDALLNVLETIHKLREGNGKVITVVGCGGDRDTAKRPLMGAVAAEHSDLVILTSDNPRSEKPEDIIEQMLEGIPVHLKKKVLHITDRKEAIRTACSMAGAMDILLVAGKGHEKYQEIQGVRHPFDDRKTIAEVFNELGK